jgi:RNA-directed DNA polymerase
LAQLKRGKAAGVDGVQVEEYEERLSEHLKGLVARMKSGSYRPQPVRRAYIAKEGGGKRPLGIPAVEDKVVQMGITRILEAMFEPEFLEASHGYRKGRSCHTALAALGDEITMRPVNYVIDADIKGFFDNVDHRWMLECLKQRVADKNFLRLVERFLKAGIMEEGKYWDTEKGTPQGGILSPVLSNIYLHYVLDLWLEKVVKKWCRVRVFEVRYCDDFIVCVQNKAEAEKILEALGLRLKKFGLELSQEKTRLIGFGRFAEAQARARGGKPATFDFLGITHYCDRNHKGGFKVGRRTSRKKIVRKLKEMNEWFKQCRSKLSLTEIWKMLKMKLEGHYRYYGMSANSKSIYRYYRRVRALVYKWLNRRSQRRSLSWEDLEKYLKRYPLPRPKLYHDLYAMVKL